MNPQFGRALFLAAWLGGGLAVPSSAAQSLSSRSPFMPEGPTAAAPTENAPLELRGIVETRDGFLFGLYDPSKKQSSWVKLNEGGADFLVRSHDLANDTVTVEYQGRSLTLGLKAAKVESMGVVPNPALATMPRNLNQPPAVLNPTPADEARRLESVAAEVRRRRMLRQAAAAQQQQHNLQGAPVPGPQPMTMPMQPQPAPAPAAPPGPR